MKAGLPLAYHHDLTPSFFEQQWQIYRKFVDNNGSGRYDRANSLEVSTFAGQRFGLTFSWK